MGRLSVEPGCGWIRPGTTLRQTRLSPGHHVDGGTWPALISGPVVRSTTQRDSSSVVCCVVDWYGGDLVDGFCGPGSAAMETTRAIVSAIGGKRPGGHGKTNS